MSINEIKDVVDEALDRGYSIGEVQEALWAYVVDATGLLAEIADESTSSSNSED